MKDWRGLLQPDSQWVLGVDECGTGAWAGPAYVCAVRVPVNWKPPPGLTTDSKKLTEAKRELLFELLRSVPRSVQIATAKEVDDEGLHAVLQRLFTQAVRALYVPNTSILLDGSMTLDEVEWPHHAIPQGDELIPAISAASVIGKVLRDLEMVKMGQLYPGYGFGIHAGYGTKAHKAAVDKKGPCPIHRFSYKPLQKPLSEAEDSPGVFLDTDDLSI